MDYLSHLPPELIKHILIHEDINPKDVGNLGLTCKKLYNNIWGNDKLLRSLFFKRWPALREMCDVKWRKNGTDVGKELKKSLKFEKRFSEHFSDFVYMMKHNYNLKKMINFMEDINRIFNNAGGNAGLRYYYLQEELMTILAENRDNYDNLTQKYYAKQLLFYLKHRHLEKEWQKFIKLPAQKQLLERAAVILSQWCQPEKRLFYRNVSSILNNIRQEVLIQLQKDYPSHSVFSVSSRQFSFWEKNNIESNYWDATETKQIINVMRKLIFNIFGYNDDDNILNDPLNFCIDTVLENRRGNYLLVSLIFRCVARRLGVRCDLLDNYFPGTCFSFCWKENYDIVNPDNGTYYNINVFQDGPIVSRDANYLGESINFNKNMYIINAPQELFLHMHYSELLERRMTYTKPNITKRLFKFFIYINSLLWYENPYVDLMGYWSLNREAEIRIEEEFYYIANKFEKRLLRQIYIKTKKRTRAMKYAIGTCVQIEHQGQFISGVIVGWDKKFVDVFNSRDPFVKMGSNREQPFYGILCCDDISFYVGENIITPQTLDAPITHQEIGRFFKKFMGSHYVPNGFLEYNYPDDIIVREKAVGLLY